MYRTHLGVEQQQMKTLTGPLSFLNLIPYYFFLFLNDIFVFWIFLLTFLILYCI